jgi:hypothetical protein
MSSFFTSTLFGAFFASNRRMIVLLGNLAQIFEQALDIDEARDRNVLAIFYIDVCSGTTVRMHRELHLWHPFLNLCKVRYRNHARNRIEIISRDLAIGLLFDASECIRNRESPLFTILLIYSSCKGDGLHVNTLDHIEIM